jgi:Ca2+-binding RTX toxin-like protein
MPVLTTDSIQVGVNGLTFTGVQVWTIAAGVTCSSELAIGVSDGGFLNARLINNGTVISDSTDGVQMSGFNSAVFNAAAGLIAGAHGINMTNGQATLTNHGSIIGYDGAGVVMPGSDGNLRNTGEITGDTYGVYIVSVGGVGRTINNSGHISGDDLAVYIDSDAFTAIINSGVMTATHPFGNVVQQAGTGQVFIVNSGLMRGALLGAGNDTVANTGEVNVVAMGAGNDTYDGAGSIVGCFVSGEIDEDTLIGGAHDDNFDGGSENDTLSGGRGDDTLIGGSGKDAITGGRDDDTLTGNSQKDTFVFKPNFGADVITDFAATGNNHDVINFRRDVFTDFADVSVAMTQVGADVMITADNGDTILVLNVIIANLGAADFSFG